jgi:hypothetical protein
MSWDKTETEITFYCESCDRSDVFNIAETRGATESGTASDFAVCWTRAQQGGWRSFKRRSWEYFCVGCAPAARAVQQERNRQDQERERLKERNSR